MKNYVVFHLHDDTSNCNGYADSTTNYKTYIKLAEEQGMKAIAFSNHGGIFDWISKKQNTDKEGLKYIHGVELYLCTKFEENERGYHIGLYAKNLEGVKEINSLVSIASSKGVEEDNTDRHFYHNPRISVEELMNTSKNVIVTTACLASILWSRREDTEMSTKILKWLSENNDRSFLEVQYHNDPDQIEYNKMLYKWSIEYNIPLIAGTDTHSATKYDAECRKVLQISKNSYYGNEDSFDLTWKSYDELVERFRVQDSLSEEVYLEAIENTNKFADMIEHFDLDYGFKYPNQYGEEAIELWKQSIYKKFDNKVKLGVIREDEVTIYQERIQEEFTIMKKQGMESFMLFMSELIDYCGNNDIPYGFCRGSVGGSVIAYITDIIDVDPVMRNTVFARFCNADRISLADIDIDFAPEDRVKVYEYIIKRFTPQKTSYIAQFGTLKDRGAIEVIAKGLEYKDLGVVMDIKNKFESIFGDYNKIIQEEVNLEEFKHGSSVDMDFHEEYKEIIRNSHAISQLNNLIVNFEKLKQENKELFYYFDGVKGTIISKGNHPSGMIGSPITLADNLGVFYKGGDVNMPVSVCAMKAVDSVNYVKFDILGLKAVGILKDAYKYANSKYLKSYEIDWEDEVVWDNMLESNVGVFQFEGDYAFSLLKQFKPRTINDMSLINASLRPSGKSYRDKLMSRQFHHNPSTEIDELLKNNYGFLVYQEDTIKFLMDICGFDGSTADTTRRAIGKKDLKLLKKQLPKIIEGYCKMSSKPREVAEKEVQEFIQIIDDSSEYQFGFNHSTGYSMNGFASVRLRTYHPLEFVTAYLNRADNESDISMGTTLAKQYNIRIMPVKFRYSTASYALDRETNSTYKGLSSIKFISNNVADELYALRDNKYDTFLDLLVDIKEKTSCNSKQLTILTKLDFFTEFGKAKKLLKIIELADYLTKSQFKKAKVEDSPFTYDQLVEYSARVTAKTFMDVDFVGLIKETMCVIKDEDITISDKAEVQLENLGYIDLQLGVDPKNCYITEIDTKWTPKVKAISLGSGKEIQFKIKEDYMSVINLQKNDIVYIHQTTKKLRSRPDGTFKKNGKPNFERIEGVFDYFITNIEKISEEEIYKDRSDAYSY